MRLVVAVVVLLAAAPLGLSSSPLGPAYSVGVGDGASFPEDVVDEAAVCGLEVGSGVADVTPGTPAAGGYHLWMEPFEDVNGNGVYDAPNPLDLGAGFDPFTDDNGNGKWDGPYMAGYAHEKQGNEYYVAHSVHDPLWARALAWRCGDLLLGMVSVDVVGLFQNQVWAIRDSVADVGFDHVIVASTHTHDAVDTMGLWGPNEVTDGKDPRTMEHVRAGAAQALRQAAASLEPVLVQAGSHSTQDPEIVAAGGYLQTDLRDPFVIDDPVYAARFVRADGSTVATLVNWSPHPETIAGTRSEISSDFPDQLRRSLETEGATVGGDARGPLGGTAVYFSGAVGGMMTTLRARVFDEQGVELPQWSYEKTDRIGEVAAYTALRALDDAPLLAPDGLRVQVREVTFALDNPFLAALNTIGLFEHPVALGPATVGAVDPVVGLVAPVPFIRTELNVVTLTAGGVPLVQIVTVPGELLPEIAVGGHLASAHGHSHGPGPASPEDCFAFNARKLQVQGGVQANINPATGAPQAGYERVLAANPEMPPEPVIRTRMSGPAQMLFGLANDELGYIVPANDYTPAVPLGFDGTPYRWGTDRCGDSDHYEETVSAGSLMGPVMANNLAHMLDGTFVPPEYPVAAGGVLGNADVGAMLAGEPVGVWVDTSGDNGFTSTEDAAIRVALPSHLSGAWGFVDSQGRDQGPEANEDTRGLWIDLDGDGVFGPRDGVVSGDHWALPG